VENNSDAGHDVRARIPEDVSIIRFDDLLLVGKPEPRM
jgi:hypothetical protein